MMSISVTVTAYKESIEHLLQIAKQSSEEVKAIAYFNTYEREISQRMEQNIQSRKVELDNSLKHKQAVEINCSIKLPDYSSLKQCIERSPVWLSNYV